MLFATILSYMLGKRPRQVGGMLQNDYHLQVNQYQVLDTFKW